MSFDAKKSMPSGWDRARIGELVGADGVFIDGDWVESEDQDPDGDVRLIQLADVGDGTYQDRSSRFLTSKKAIELRCTFLKQGDVLIARMPDPLGRACIFPGDSKRAVTVVDVCIVRTGRMGANHRWLTWAINSPDFRSAVAGLQSGSTRKRISRGNLATLFLPIPPLAEETRIADEIEKQFTRLDAAVFALKRIQVNLKRYRAAVLKAACEGRLVPTEAVLARCGGRSLEPASVLLERILVERRSRWEAARVGRLRAAEESTDDDGWKKKYKQPCDPILSDDMPHLADGWCWATAEQCTTVVTDGEHITPPRSESGVLLLSARNILNGRLSLDEVDYIPESVHEKLNRRLSVEPGDVLLSCSGSVGRSCTAPEGLRFSLVRSVAVLKPIFKMGPYLSLALRSPFLQSQIVTKQTQTAQANIFQGKIKTLICPLPPLAEQIRIVVEVDRRLSIIEELATEVRTNLKRTERLRQSILKRAFEGKMLPQNSDDEPAGVLLEKIRAEREQGNVHAKRPSARGVKERIAGSSGAHRG